MKFRNGQWGNDPCDLVFTADRIIIFFWRGLSKVNPVSKAFVKVVSIHSELCEAIQHIFISLL